MDDLDKFLNKQLEDKEFKKEWDRLELRYMIIEQLIKIRNVYNLSQSQLAEKLGTTQSVISRIENGTVNIGIDFIDKLARAFDKKVEFRLI
ncbi:DNA-binding protein, putative [hydrothermal vent metagenome]|uniref:DNA-binding protein, putative n=1 Tax=hydrothermal vent metagenome TaxID=652676 RepID=A0A1W1CGL5_9ZZZZ